MYKNVCRHCHAEIECETARQFANHVRWCTHNPDRNKDKFLLYCCCLVCKTAMTVQSLSQHLVKHDREGEVKTHCEWCSKPVYKKYTRFCNQSCAANHSNSIRDYTKFKAGPEKGWMGPQIPYKLLSKRRKEIDNDSHQTRPRKPDKFVTEICKVCSTPFQKKSASLAKCCSKDCRMSIISLNRGRHKKSWLESSFSEWLDSKGILYETEVTVKNLEENKWYYLDFLFKDLNLIIELDGSQHKDTVDSDTKRDNYLRSIGYTVLRITHEEYQSKKKLPEVEKLLGL